MERRAAAESEGLPVTDESRPSWRRKIRDQVSPIDGKKQLEAPPLSLFHRFSERIPPFPFPIPQTTMADAAEHDEELVDYDEEEVG